MSDRVSETILLCEDELHERFVKAYMKECGLETGEPYVRPFVASRLHQGGNVDWVMHEFPNQLHACRQRQKKARTRLVVVLDADRFTLAERLQQLNYGLKQAGHEPLKATDPVVLLVPRRHAETWIRSLLGEKVNEEQDCKSWDKLTKDEIRRAARTAYQWARENAAPGPTCVPSLCDALPQLRKIG